MISEISGSILKHRIFFWRGFEDHSPTYHASSSGCVREQGLVPVGVAVDEPLVGCGAVFQQPIGPSGPLNLVSAAVRTNPVKVFVAALRTECAFKRANPGINRVWGQVFVTTFAIWFEQ